MKSTTDNKPRLSLVRVLPAQRAARAEDLIERADGLPAQPGKKLDGGLLDQRVFVVAARPGDAS